MHVPVFPVVFTVQDLPLCPPTGVGLESPVLGRVAVPGLLPDLLPDFFSAKPKQSGLPSGKGALCWFKIQ